jgi:general secretion pathway protein B
MSFILDALRKSDAERQRAAAPGLADVRYALRRSRRNIWLPILVVVLAANMVFMGVQWFWRGSEKPATAPEMAASGPSASGQPLTAPAVDANPAPATNIRPLAREAEFGEPLPEPEMDRDFAPEPLLEPPPEPATVATTTPSRILVNNDLPSAEQLIGTGGLSIPVLNLDLHVYSEESAGRFVVISSRKYKEGGQLTEGPTVESITRDGVILAYQGQRFTLSRR